VAGDVGDGGDDAGDGKRVGSEGGGEEGGGSRDGRFIHPRVWQLGRHPLTTV
jgi:hypothetical protein